MKRSALIRSALMALIVAFIAAAAAAPGPAHAIGCGIDPNGEE